MQQNKFTPRDLLRYTVVFAVLVVFMFPIYMMITTSFKAPLDILVSPPRWTFQPTLENYVYAFQVAKFGHYIKNTLIVTLLSTLIVVAVATLASYSFARYNVGGGNLMFFILTTRIIHKLGFIHRVARPGLPV